MGGTPQKLEHFKNFIIEPQPQQKIRTILNTICCHGKGMVPALTQIEQLIFLLLEKTSLTILKMLLEAMDLQGCQAESFSRLNFF